jgi:lysozyme family protein
MSNFDKAFAELLGNEGGYTNNPNDPGGETNWGVTLDTARENGYLGAMKDMDQSVAKAIYFKRYWLPAFDALPYPVAFQVFDGAVNSGVGQAVRWLQRAVGVADDGKLGPLTLDAVSAAPVASVVLLFNAARLEFMTNLSTWPSFGKGWARRIAGNLKKGAA